MQNQFVDSAEAHEERDLRYLHSPFLDPADYLQALKWLRYTPPPAPPVRRLPVPHRPRLRSQLAESALDSWHQYQFSLAEQDVWMAHGLTPHEVDIAVACRAHELAASTLWQKIDGRTVHDHLKAGATAAAIAAVLRGTTARSA